MEQKTGSGAGHAGKMRITAAPAGLPKDTVHLEVSVPMDDPTPVAAATPPPVRGQKPPRRRSQRRSRRRRAPVVVHVLAVPDGSATWLGLVPDGKLPRDEGFAGALSTASDANTLGKTAGVDAPEGAEGQRRRLVTLRAASWS